jgi:hypothetical protein
MNNTIINPFKLNATLPASSAGSILGGRAFTAAVIQENWKPIARKIGNVFGSSTDVLRAMHSLDITYSIEGKKLTSSNAIGDILGAKVFNLPSTGTGKRLFYLPALAMTPAEREEFLALPKQEMAKAIRQANAELLAEDLPEISSTVGIEPDHSLDAPEVEASELDVPHSGPAFLEAEDDGDQDLAAA